MKKMSTNDFLGCSHLLTTNNAGCITSAQQTETIKHTTTIEYLEIKQHSKRWIKYSRIEFFRCCIWKTIIHVGSNLSITNVISNMDLEVTKCFIELLNQMQSQTIIPKDAKQTLT